MECHREIFLFQHGTLGRCNFAKFLPAPWAKFSYGVRLARLQRLLYMGQFFELRDGSGVQFFRLRHEPPMRAGILSGAFRGQRVGRQQPPDGEGK